MIRRLELTREQAEAAMSQGEFGEDVRDASRLVAVVLTQDWCGQWAAMDGYLTEMGSRHPELELTVFLCEYNRVDYFQEFLNFKEQVLGNRLIPYVRYYREGSLVGQSNYVSERQFLSFFQENSAVF
jgi:hypothetical protein